MRRWTFLALCATASLILLPTALRAEAPSGPNLGKPLTEFELTDWQGKEHRLADYSQYKLLVVAVMGTECPLAKMYASRLQELRQEYQDKNVGWIALDANSQDSLAEIGAFARRQKFELPFLKDRGTEVADRLGATRTPEVFVLDQQRVIRYAGRVDDQFAIGVVRKEPTQQNLKDAIDQLLAGEEVKQPMVAAVGCKIGRIQPNNSQDSSVTYSNTVAHILQKRCVECHRSGEIGPMALEQYSEVAGWADMIQEVVSEKRMPPWHADPAHGEFANDRSLTAEEREAIATWVAAGAPEGDPKDLPPPVTYTEGWQLPRQPDLIVPMSDKPFSVPASGDVRYQYFRVDPKLTEEKWLSAAEIQPGNRAVVHHVLVFARQKGSKSGLEAERGFLVGYVPGSRFQPYPEGMAKRIPADSELIFQVHYTPIGSPQEDLSRLGLVFADPKTITHEVKTTSAVQVRLNIPPNDANYETSAMLPEKLPDCELLLMSPHMHLRGKSYRYQAIYPDGTKKTLLDIPNYDFNWQTAYWLKNPMRLPEGSKIYCEAVFDNSAKNLNNPDPNARVRWGDQTYEEMMIGYFDIAVKKSDSAQGEKKPGGGILPITVGPEVFGRLDKDGDKLLKKEEIPTRFQRFFERIDTDGNGTIDREEFRKVESD